MIKKIGSDLGRNESDLFIDREKDKSTIKAITNLFKDNNTLAQTNFIRHNFMTPKIYKQHRHHDSDDDSSSQEAEEITCM